MQRLTFLFLMMALSSCSATVTTSTGTEEGGRCVLNSDCRGFFDAGLPLICIYGRCHNACKSDEDCPRKEFCRASVKPINVCLLEDELRCPNGTDRECPGPAVCGPDRLCRDPCKSNRDCLPDGVCTQGICATPAEVDAGAVVAPAQGRPCRYTSECDQQSICQTGTCQVQCLTERDCDRGYTCSSGRCTMAEADGGLPRGFGAPCDFTSDCPPALFCGVSKTCTVECTSVRDCAATSDCCSNFRCLRGAACFTPDAGAMSTPDAGCGSDRDCQDGVLCNGAEQCIGGMCRVAVRDLCDDGNPCTIDSCAELGLVCTHTSILVPPDDDHDGHSPISCGRDGDDCDDHNPFVYRGAKELCDFVDNDCNGQVDEGLWGADLASRGALSTGNFYLSNAGPPRGKRVGNSVFVAANSGGTPRGTIDLFAIDPSLSTATGPVVVGGSRTTWASCFYNGGPIPGRVATLGELAFQPDGGGLVTWLEGTYPSNTQMCCDTAVGPRATGFATPFHGFSFGDAGVIGSTIVTGNGCSGAFNRLPRGIEPASATWNEALGQYVISWAAVVPPTSTYQLLFAKVDPVSGVLTASQQVVQAGGGIVGSETATNLANFVVVASSPSGVLFMWLQGSPSEARYVVINPTLTQRIAGPSLLSLAGGQPRAPLHAEWTGSSFLVLLGPTSGTGTGAHQLVSIDANGVQQWTRALPAGSAGPPQAPLGISAPEQATFALVGSRGYLAAITQDSRFSFTYGPVGADAGTLEFDFDTGRPARQRSDPAIIPVDDRTVLVVWADDNLQKVVLRCVE